MENMKSNLAEVEVKEKSIKSALLEMLNISRSLVAHAENQKENIMQNFHIIKSAMQIPHLVEEDRIENEAMKKDIDELSLPELVFYIEAELKSNNERIGESINNIAKNAHNLIKPFLEFNK